MPTNFTEMKIPVPYGYIAAKVWGSLKDHSIKCIAMHGYMDNAGTFDRLIPLLPDQFYVVAIDLPGHGFSSHVPYGEYCNYNPFKHFPSAFTNQYLTSNFMSK